MRRYFRIVMPRRNVPASEIELRFHLYKWYGDDSILLEVRVASVLTRLRPLERKERRGK